MKLSLHTLHRLVPLISLTLFVVAIAVVHHEIEVYHWQTIEDALMGFPRTLLAQMVLVTLLGYLALCFYDYLALEYAGEKLPFRRVALASFLSYAISNNVGHAMISGGSMRFRLYSGWGITAASIAKIVIFCGFTYIIGAVTLLFAGYMSLPEHTAISDTVSPLMAMLVIAVAAALLTCWWGGIMFYRKEIKIKFVRFVLPRPSLALRQTGVALIDLLLASLVLYLPVSHALPMPYGSFLVLYVVAQLVGLVSQVPGGIGVFEGSFLFLAANHYPSSDLLAALIAYRAVYFLLPLLISAFVLAAYEFRVHRLLRIAKLRKLSHYCALSYRKFSR